MTAPLRHTPTDRRLDPLEAFWVRALTRAYLWRCGQFDLPEAVDRLQADAVRDGLVAELGQDEVQAIIAEAFVAVHDESSWPLVLETSASDETFTAMCRAADERQRKKPIDFDGLTARARRLLDDSVSIARLWAEMNESTGREKATLEAAEYLIAHSDRKQFCAWLVRHSAKERQVIREHLRKKGK